MNLNFDIETPKCCHECKFHYIDNNSPDRCWASYCLICPDVKETIETSRNKRSDNCIGTVSMRE